MKKTHTSSFNPYFLSAIVLIVILLIAAYLRLWRIGDYMSFLGDEGRDVLVVKRMIVDHKFTLLGPVTSVGLMHLGPMYYYFMVPFLLLFRLDPVGPAVMVALFSLAAIVLLWKTSVEFFDSRTAFISATLYALSPLVITYSHSSWNPNILPFWSLLIIYSLLKVYVKKQYLYLMVTGLALGVVVQLHYVALVFIPIIFVVLAMTRFNMPRKYLLYGLLAGLLVYSPYILFEFRHDFINTKTVFEFVTRMGNRATFSPGTLGYKFWDLSVRLFWRLIVIKNAQLSIFLMLVSLGLGAYFLLQKSKSAFRSAVSVLVVWYLVGIGLLSLYMGSIYDYYLMFAFPLPFLLTGASFSYLTRKRSAAIFAIVAFGFITYFQIKVTPILKEPNRLAAQAKDIAQFIIGQAHNQPYNFALIAGMNSDHAYRYFLEISGNPPIEIKNQVEDPPRATVAPQLFVVCEEKICQPLGHPLWEIAGYGRAEIAGEWSVGLFRVFKLVPYYGS